MRSRGCLMASVLYSWSNCPGSSRGRGHFVLFLSNTHLSQCLSLLIQVYNWILANCWGKMTEQTVKTLCIMTLNSASAVRTCIVGVPVTNESNRASYFFCARNLNGSNADRCADVVGPSSRGSGDCLSLDLALDPLLLLFSLLLALLAATLDLSVTATPILPFGACYVIMHKVHYVGVRKPVLLTTILSTSWTFLASEKRNGMCAQI